MWEHLVDRLVYNWLGMDPEAHFVKALHFFIYDSVKVLFLMAVIGASFQEMVILRKVLKIPLLVIFFGILTTGIILTGYLFNAIL